MNCKIVNYFYYNATNSPILCWCCRDKNGNFHLIQIKDEKLRPFFGVLKSEWNKVNREKLPYEIIKIEDAPNSLYGEEVVNLYAKFPWQVGNIREIRLCKNCDKIIYKKGRKYHCDICMKDYWKKDTIALFSQTFTADVKWNKMAMSKIIRMRNLDGPYAEIPDDYMYKRLKIKDINRIDNDDHFLVDYRICYYDIETDSRDLPPKSEYKHYGDMSIISLVCYDSYEGDYTEFVWHPDFVETRYCEKENHKIVHKKKEIVIDKIKRWECETEEEMLKKFFDYFAERRFDILFGYFSEGGYRKQGGRRIWINGFDTPMVYARSEELNLLEEMQKMSPCPILTRKYSDNYEGVYLRKGRGNKRQIVIKGVTQIDYVFTDENMNFARKHYDFRGGRLADWMSFFLDFPKMDKNDHNVWEYWLGEV